MKLMSSGRLKETSFERVLWKLNQLQKYDNEYPNTLYPIELRGNNLNAGDLNPELLFSLGLISKAEFNAIVLAKSHPIEYELHAAEAPEDFECAICLDESKDEVVWFPWWCHMFHRACLNTALAIEPRCPLCGVRAALAIKQQTM